MSSEQSLGHWRHPDPARDPLRLDLNEAPREPEQGFHAALLAELSALSWRRYPDLDAGSARDAAARLYGWNRDGTLVGNGSNELLAAAVRALLPRGGRLFALSPSFSMYPVLAERMGAELRTLPLEPPAFEPSSEELLSQARECDLVVLCSPNNPTGGQLPEAVIDAVCRAGRPVVWDGAYLEFSGTDPRALLLRHRHLMVLRSLSKAWGLAGLRAGAMLTSAETAGRVARELLPFATGHVVAAAYRAAAADRQAGPRLVAETVAERERQVAAIGAIAGLEVVSSAANFFLVRRVGWSGRRLAATLRERGIAVRDIAELDGAGYVRITVGSADEGDELRAALREVARE